MSSTRYPLAAAALLVALVARGDAALPTVPAPIASAGVLTRVTLFTSAPGLALVVDGQPAGKSPVIVDLRAGKHVAALASGCHEESRVEFEVESAAPRALELKAVPKRAGVRVEVTGRAGVPIDGEVKVEGAAVGRTSTALPISACATRLEVITREGTWIQRIAPVAGSTLVVDVGVRAGVISGLPGSEWSSEDTPIPVSSKDASWGERSAPVTIVVFGDFTCPLTAVARPVLERIRKSYGPRQVRIVWKHLPASYRPNANGAAEAAERVFVAKGAAAFWRFSEKLFSNPRSITEESLATWEREAGVARDEPSAAATNTKETRSKIEGDIRLATAIGVEGTPAVFVDGTLVPAGASFDDFKIAIDAALVAARGRLANGTPRDKLYEVASRANFVKPAPAAAESDESQTVFKAPLGASPVRGDRTAPVTAVFFGDLECEPCSRAFRALERVRAEQPGVLRVVWKHVPKRAHVHAEAAANFVEEARSRRGEGGYWQAIDALLALDGKVDDATFDSLAPKLGLDQATTRAAMGAKRHDALIRADEDLADDLRALSTPQLFLNGRPMGGEDDVEILSRAVSRAAVAARARLASGVQADALYDAIIAEGAGAPEFEKRTVARPSGAAPSRGPTAARVTIMQFSDFECPFCGRVEPVLDDLLEKYRADVRLVWRNYPLPMHPDAPLAAEAALEAFAQAGNDGFWAMHRKLFANNRALSRADLERYASEQGLDVPRFKAALDARLHKREVEDDARAAKDAGITGTPAFVINGYFISGAQPLVRFRKAVERALAEAR